MNSAISAASSPSMTQAPGNSIRPRVTGPQGEGGKTVKHVEQAFTPAERRSRTRRRAGIAGSHQRGAAPSLRFDGMPPGASG